MPDRRRRGIGSALLAEVRERARGFGRETLQGEVRESDPESREFLEHRGFVQVGGEKAVALDLTQIDAPEVDPPQGVRIVTRVDEPDRLDEMYAVERAGGRGHPGLRGRADVRAVARARDRPADAPARALLHRARRRRGRRLCGAAGLRRRGHHGLTATRRDWRRRGVAAALKRAEIAAAKRAGFRRLLTESEERNEPMRRLNEKLGYVPAPEWSMVVMQGPVTPQP